MFGTCTPRYYECRFKLFQAPQQKKMTTILNLQFRNVRQQKSQSLSGGESETEGSHWPS